ncbi:hypothetical protein [Methanocella conradii]|uniref:hypothetical protein n=1 Tax=Methanocella conradii TaxID=1175444 RepID=UPI00157E0A3A|nr:hypothetical protein [Methanocella conradii]
MDEKFKKAIIAGVICGVILIVLSFIYTVGIRLAFGSELQSWLSELQRWLEQYNAGYVPEQGIPEVPMGVIIAGAASLILIALGALTFIGAGLLAAIMGAQYIKTRNDALIAGAVAGAAAEVVHRPFAMIFYIVMDIVSPLTIAQYGTTPTIISAAWSALGQLICCFPAVLVCGVVLSLLGALAYAMLKLKV